MLLLLAAVCQPTTSFLQGYYATVTVMIWRSEVKCLLDDGPVMPRAVPDWTSWDTCIKTLRERTNLCFPWLRFGGDDCWNLPCSVHPWPTCQQWWHTLRQLSVLCPFVCVCVCVRALSRFMLRSELSSGIHWLVWLVGAMTFTERGKRKRARERTGKCTWSKWDACIRAVEYLSEDQL